MSKLLMPILCLTLLTQAAFAQEKLTTVVNEGAAVSLVQAAFNNNSRINVLEIKLNDDNSVLVVFEKGKDKKQCSATVKMEKNEDDLTRYTLQEGFCFR